MSTKSDPGSTHAPPKTTDDSSMFLDVLVSATAGLALGLLVVNLLGMSAGDSTSYAPLVVLGSLLFSILAGVIAHTADSTRPRVPGAAGLTAARFLTDWTIRLLLIAYLTVWARGAYQLSQAETRARAAAEQERIRQLIRERGLDR